MNRSADDRIRLLSILPVALACLLQPMYAQDTVFGGEREGPKPPSQRFSLGFSIGGTITNPSGTFPSLLFVTSADSTGEAPAENATAGIASRWGLNVTVPITGRFSAQLEGGSRIWSIRYREGESSRSVRMDLQTSWVALLGRLTLFEPARVSVGETAFSAGIEGGIEFGFGPYRNRVETTIPADTGGATLAPVEGSFRGGDPFRGPTGLTGGVWGGMMVGENVDLRLEGGYIHPFNPLFSDEALEGNDARMSQFTIDIGVNYLF